MSLVFLALFLLFGKYGQRKEFLAEKLKLLKNPLSILIALFLLTGAVSTIFAKDSFRAFFGTVERGEGFVGLLFFGLIFFLAVLIFEQKEWQWFFGGTIASGIIFFLHQLFQLSEAQWDFGLRPFATFGNPSLLAGYYLFVIFSCLVLLSNFWPRFQHKKLAPAAIIFPVIALITAIFGIFLTQTRGTYLGFAVGAGTAVLYLLWRVFLAGGKKRFFKFAVPVFLLAVVALGVIWGVLFLSSWSASLDDKDSSAGSFDLLSSINRRLTETGAFQTRLIAARISLRSISPANEGLGRFLFGWGPENYKIAYNTYFDPRYFIYEDVWFDRAHNKVLDVLVMQGLFGLIVFLGIWVLVLFYAFKIKKPPVDSQGSLIRPAVLFFAISYFVHDLFLFESPAASVALFMFFAFVVFTARPEKTRNKEEPSSASERSLIISPIFFSSAAILMALLFFWSTLAPYLQMKYYIGIKTNKAGNLTLKEFTLKLDKAFSPYTYAQENIRVDLLKSLPDIKAEEGIAQLAIKTFEAMDELIEKEPYEPRHSMNMGQTLEEVAGRPELYERAEFYYRQALDLVPNRPDLLYLLAQNLVFQGKIEEAQPYLDELLRLSKEIPKAGVLYGAALLYAPDEYRANSFAVLERALNTPGALDRLGSALPAMRLIYNDFLAEFVKAKDEENFLKALKTAILVEETWEKNQEELFRRNKIKELPWKEESERKSLIYRNILERFPEEGWSLVGVKEK